MRSIEEGVRKYVMALRDVGINTFCSCHHEGYIQAETYDAENEINDIYNTLVEMGVTEYTAVLTYSLIGGGCTHRFWEIKSPAFIVTED